MTAWAPERTSWLSRPRTHSRKSAASGCTSAAARWGDTPQSVMPGVLLLWNFLFLFRSRLSPSARCCRLPSTVLCPQTSPDGRTNGGDLRRQTKPLQMTAPDLSYSQNLLSFPLLFSFSLSSNVDWMMITRGWAGLNLSGQHFLNFTHIFKHKGSEGKKGEFLEATWTTDAYTSYLKSTMVLMVQKRTRWAQKWDSTWVSFVCVDLCLFWYTWRYIIRTVDHKLESSICARVTSDCFSKKIFWIYAVILMVLKVWSVLIWYSTFTVYSI